MSQSAETAYPIPTVRLVVTDAEGRVLILRRQKTRHSDGQWCLPGGKVAYGETVEESVRRELKEETGLDCLEARFLFYQDSLPLQAGRMHCINFYFECQTAGSVVLDQESSDFLWIGREELPQTELVFRNGEGLAVYWDSDY